MSMIMPNTVTCLPCGANLRLERNGEVKFAPPTLNPKKREIIERGVGLEGCSAANLETLPLATIQFYVMIPFSEGPYFAQPHH